MNRHQRRAQAVREKAWAAQYGEPKPALVSQRLEASLGAAAPRTSLRSAAWQSAMRKLWAMEHGK